MCGLHEPSNRVRLQGGLVAASPSDVWRCRVDRVVGGFSKRSRVERRALLTWLMQRSVALCVGCMSRAIMFACRVGLKGGGWVQIKHIFRKKRMVATLGGTMRCEKYRSPDCLSVFV